MTGNVVRALKHEGYRHVTILDVSAIHEPLWREEGGLSPDLGVYSRMAKLEIICKNEDTDTIVGMIRSAAHTGNRFALRIPPSDVYSSLQTSALALSPDGRWLAYGSNESGERAGQRSSTLSVSMRAAQPSPTVYTHTSNWLPSHQAPNR